MMTKFRRSSVPMSKGVDPELGYEYVKEAARGNSEWSGHVSVPPSHLRATSPTVARNYDKKADRPGFKPRELFEGEKEPLGIRTPDGLVHMIDGHHRADRAVRKGVNLDVKVVDADYEDFK